MELNGERLIPATVEATWAALNDPEVLKSCITGCESLERTGDDRFVAKVTVKVGPVSARFTGKLELTDVQPPQRYTIHFDGQGGVAGFGKGSADVALSAEAEGRTKLAYKARAQVGGKLAQVGSRLVDAAAAKIADDFFRAFDARFGASATPAMVRPSGAGIDASLGEPTRGGATVAAARQPTHWGWWVIAALIVVETVYFIAG